MHEPSPEPPRPPLSVAEMLAALTEGRLTAPERQRIVQDLADHPELRGWLARAILCMDENGGG